MMLHKKVLIVERREAEVLIKLGLTIQVNFRWEQRKAYLEMRAILRENQHVSSQGKGRLLESRLRADKPIENQMQIEEAEEEEEEEVQAGYWEEEREKKIPALQNLKTALMRVKKMIMSWKFLWRHLKAQGKCAG
jgi:hypothetical protein